jgi:hypothetical protein
MGEGASKIACRGVSTPVFVSMLTASAAGIFPAPMLRRATLSDCLKLQFGMLHVPAAKLRRQTQVEPRLRSLGGVHMERRHQEHTHAIQTGHQLQPGRVPESVNRELIFRQISPLGDPTTQSMAPSSHEKSGSTQMQNSNNVARCFGSMSRPCSSWVPAC